MAFRSRMVRAAGRPSAECDYGIGVRLAPRRSVELQQIAVRIKEVKAPAGGSFNGRNAVDFDAPLFHLLDSQLEIVRRNAESVVRRAVFLDRILLDRLPPLEQNHHSVFGAPVGPGQM